jgi:hypothetical protein
VKSRSKRVLFHPPAVIGSPPARALAEQHIPEIGPVVFHPPHSGRRDKRPCSRMAIHSDATSTARAFPSFNFRPNDGARVNVHVPH